MSYKWSSLLVATLLGSTTGALGEEAKVRISDGDWNKLLLAKENIEDLDFYLNQKLEQGKIVILDSGEVIVNFSVLEVLKDSGRIKDLEAEKLSGGICARTKEL